MSDRIGIKIQTEFPSVAEMQRQLNAKWKSVKNNFKGKINVDVDGNSLKSMQSKIKKALGKEVFEIKINTGNAVSQISEMGRSVKRLDDNIKKVSNLKIKVDASELNKALKGISQDVKKADKVADAHTNKIKSQTNAYKNQQATVSRLVETTKRLSDGSTVNDTKTKHDLGHGVTADEQSDSTGKSSLKYTLDREKSLREIHKIMKNINRTEKDMIGATEKSKAVYQKELGILKEQLGIFDKQYKEIYKQGSALDNVLSKEVARQGQLDVQLKRIEQQRKAEKDRDNNAKKALQEVVKLEQDKFRISKNLINTKKEESNELKRQLAHYDHVQKGLLKKYDLQKNMTKEQRTEWHNLQRINNLLLDQERAKKRDLENEKKASAEQRKKLALQKQAYSDIQSSAKKVHNIELDILKIKSRQQSSQARLTQEEAQKLEILKKELSDRRQNLSLISQEQRAQGNVTKEMEKQLATEKKIMDREKNRVSETSKLLGKQDQINSKVQKYLDITKQIGQLNRDLVYAGMREQNVIESQIRHLKNKQSVIKNNLQSQNALTSAVKDEIKAIQRAQTEQHSLNRARQKAREGDKHYRDTHGVINPHTALMNARRGGMTAYESLARVDEAFIGVAKVADAPEDRLERFRMESFDNASSLGVQSNEYMNAVERWITSGKSLKESEEKAKASLIGSFVGQIDPEEMVRYMGVPLNAYRGTGLDEHDVINTMNELSNNFAIEMLDIGKGLARSSGSMSNAGASYAEQLSYLTAAQELTRRGGERIGTGLRTIGMRFGRIGAGETGEQANKREFFKERLGIDFLDEDGGLRNIHDVLGELAEMWDDVSDTDKTTAKFHLAGMEHSETLGAMLEGWDIVEDALGQAEGELDQGESGSAYKEHAEQQDSIKFKTAELKNTWDEFIHTVVGGKDGIVAVMDAMISGLETVTKLAGNEDLMRALKFILGGIGIHAGVNAMRRGFGILATGMGGFLRDGVEAVGIMSRLNKESDKTAKKGAKNNKNNKKNIGSSAVIARRANPKDQKEDKNSGKSAVVRPTPAPKAKSSRQERQTTVARTAPRATPAPTPAPQPQPKQSGGMLLGRTPKIANKPSKPDNTGKKVNNEIKSSADKADKSIVKMNSTMRSTGKLFKLGLGMIPLLGDALLIAEFMGVPVFETIGKGWKSITRSTEETIAKEEEYARQFMLTNDITNGEMKKKEKAVKDLTKSYEEMTEGGKVELNEEEFFDFQERFNKLAEDLGFDIEIEMNDTTHIESKIKELKNALNELSKDEQREIGFKLTEDAGKVDETLSQIISKQKGLGEVKDQLDTYRQALENMHELDPNYDKTVNEIERLEQVLIDGGAEVDQLTDKMNRQKDISLELATVLMEQGSALDTLKYSEEEKITILGEMGEAYNQVYDSLQETKQAQDEFTNSGKLTQEQWVDLYDTIDDEGFRSTFSATTANMINDNDELRQAVEDYIVKVNEGKESTLESGSASIEILETETGIQIKLNDEIEEGGKKSEKAGEESANASKKASEANEATGKTVDTLARKTGGWRDEILKVPSEKKTDLKINTFGKPALDEVHGKMSEGNKSVQYTVKFKTFEEVVKNVTYPNKANGTSFLGAMGRHTSTVNQDDLNQAVSNSISTAESATGMDLSPIAGVSRSESSAESGEASVDMAKSTKSSSSKNNSRVNQDVWRHWRTEMYGIDRLEKRLSELAIQMERRKDNETQLIKLYKQQQSLLRSQVKQYKTLEKSKRSELNTVLNRLKKQGFKVDKKTGRVTNLSRAKSLKGTKAEKAETNLNQWKSLYEEVNGIQTTILSLNQEIRGINENIKDANITKEFKSWEKPLRKVDLLLNSIENKTRVADQRLSFVGDRNMELNLRETEIAMNEHKTNMSKLITEFDKLSVKKISYKENAEQIESTLQSLADSILSQADAIADYNIALNDMKFDRVIVDFESLGNAIEGNVSRIDNSIENLREGLLSGTGINDLQSSIAESLNLNRSNQYQKLALERIALEKSVNDAMEAFAKKNVDRQKNVANKTLKINKSMYNQLLKMERQYSSKSKITYNKINQEFGTLNNIGNVDSEYKFVKELDDIYAKLTKKQKSLYSKYQKDIAKAKTDSDKEDIDDQFIIDNLKLQEDYHKGYIEATNRAIKELNKQLKSSSVTEDQKYAIKEQVAQYESDIIDAQNSIKESIRSRFEYEFELIERAIDKYEKYANEVQYAIDILDIIGGQNQAPVGVLLNEMLSIERARNKHLNETVNTLDEQLALYEKGSFEWKLINEEVEEYRDLLKESNKELLEIGKNIMSTSFEDLLIGLEKELFDGKTLQEFERYRDLWLNDVEREIALEEAYERFADISSDIHQKRMEELEKRDKISRFEMDYLNKQLDVLELQQKIDNLNKERNVQTLKQNADGTWDWMYEADKSELDSAKEELREAQRELSNMEEESRKEYVSKLGEILTDAEEGQYKTAQELRDALNDLSNAFESIVGNYENIGEDYIDNLVKTYDKYLKDSQKIVDDVGLSADLDDSKYYDGFSVEVVKTIDNLGKNIEKSFAKAFSNEIPKLAEAMNKQTGNITIEKVEFPNATSQNEIEKAIMSLPQVALQKSKTKTK